jgi:hypothetical protein
MLKKTVLSVILDVPRNLCPPGNSSSSINAPPLLHLVGTSLRQSPHCLLNSLRIDLNYNLYPFQILLIFPSARFQGNMT